MVVEGSEEVLQQTIHDVQGVWMVVEGHVVCVLQAPIDYRVYMAVQGSEDVLHKASIEYWVCTWF